MELDKYIMVPCPHCGHQLFTMGCMTGGYGCGHCGKKFKTKEAVEKYCKEYKEDYKRKEKHYEHRVFYSLEMAIKAVVELRNSLKDRDLYTDWIQIEVDALYAQVKKVDSTVKGQIKDMKRKKKIKEE
jgi:uncharacterized Zn finger protein (UPF0148 family)